MFKGIITALVTPFKKDLSIDFEAFKELIEWQIKSGINGIVILGTTGESPTITSEERTQLITEAVKLCKNKIPLIVGTGSNCSKKTLAHTLEAQNLGANGVLIVTPYYNKPSQEGLYQHFKYVATNSNVPIIMYNVPGRTGIDMQNETVARLANIKNIVGIKDCCGFERIKQIKDLIDNSEFKFFTGDDPIAVEYNKNGGNGCISAVGNVIPSLCAELQNLTAQNDYKKAEQIHNKLESVYNALFSATNPIAIKYAISKLGKIENNLRLPLTTLDAENSLKVDIAMNNLKAEYELAS